MASTSFPDHLKARLVAQMHDDPGIPKPQPTISAWQVPVAPLAETQSSTLPPVTDFAIIGSGITGCSVAKHLLENTSVADKTVTVFEARTLTSGATGRNGGHLLSHVPKIFKSLSTEYGRDTALKIARYSTRTVEKMVELARSAGSEVKKGSELRSVREIMTFEEESAFYEAVDSVRLYEDSLPQEKGRYSTIGQESVQGEYHVKNAIGALTAPAYAFWPYRLVTGIWQQLLAHHPNRFSIETRTPVTSIAYAPSIDSNYPYILSTPRGVVRAAQIFHCANGFTGHLLPLLRGKIFPYRGSMSCQSPGPNFPNLGSEYLWILYTSSTHDPTAGTLDSKLYHMHQNAVTGEIFCGGDKRYLGDIINSNDEELPGITKDNLDSFTSKFFAGPWVDKLGDCVDRPFEHREAWSGIIGMTPDFFPLVGKVPQSISGRATGGGEWIAAGYSGYGMPQCWSCGEAIARMALGEPTPEWLPDICLLSEERLKDERHMGVEAALGFFYGKR